ncbi:MAG: NAD-dependent epimerase/dehydratase family protein [Phycicoccus sp.]
MDTDRQLHVVVGAGPVGTAVALLLAEQGRRVRMVSRSGRGPEHPAVERVRLDATDVEALTRSTVGAQVLYNCANPAYHRWASDWPPLASALLETATRCGAVLATVGNLYGYGPTDHPMRESDPLRALGTKGRVRAQMWRDALAAHQAGRVRVVEVRGSDYFGPGVIESHLGERIVPKVLAGRSVRVVGDPDAPHTWTYVPDVARTVVTMSRTERTWGRAWHVPSLPPRSARSMVLDLCRAAGVSPVFVGSVPRLALLAGGLFVPQLRELRETLHQFDRPFVMDSSAATAACGIEPTPLAEALAATVAGYRERRSAPVS